MRTHERGCTRYLVFEQQEEEKGEEWEEDAEAGSGSAGVEKGKEPRGKVLMLVETWTGEDALEKHHRSGYLTEHQRRLEEEGLVGRPENIVRVGGEGGWER